MTEQVKRKSKLKTTLALIITAIPLAIGGALLATNPSKDDYANYALAKVCDYPNLPKQVAAQFQQACKGSVAPGSGLFGRDTLKNAIASKTEQQNYLFFSTYKTELFNRSFTTVGVFGQFVTIGAQ
ncbi:DUF4359 domain-containing protein [Oscillatoria sp. FACHB-1406]|uniref:DUF4359 domain-containing protein n=1 Tax=Oscillatoria sp. FACHB-1406 TaxID=2692846 RepID=UPI001686F548|nr:DUF4359 domain-containing protein [Oscillatoria sp. FACHB-1406]MBD2576671.1 DUF4359 domain-containing protein [Oscillatoria sp. FACHB-1406]